MIEFKALLMGFSSNHSPGWRCFEYIVFLTLNDTHTHTYIYICRAVSPLNSQTATKVARGGGGGLIFGMGPLRAQRGGQEG